MHNYVCQKPALSDSYEVVCCDTLTVPPKKLQRYHSAECNTQKEVNHKSLLIRFFERSSWGKEPLSTSEAQICSASRLHSRE